MFTKKFILLSITQVTWNKYDKRTATLLWITTIWLLVLLPKGTPDKGGLFFRFDFFS
jgi:hypothetical protein